MSERPFLPRQFPTFLDYVIDAENVGWQSSVPYEDQAAVGEQARAELAELRARVAALTRVAVAADDYWNGNGTSGAVLDALTEARAIGALPDAAPAGEGT